MKGENVIEAYCDECQHPITEAAINAGFAVIRNKKETDRATVQVCVHLFHTHEARDVLSDDKYMAAVGEFIDKLNEMIKKCEMSGDTAKKIAQAIANRERLDFEQLELAIRAFYSYSMFHKKEESDAFLGKNGGDSEVT